MKSMMLMSVMLLACATSQPAAQEPPPARTPEECFMETVEPCGKLAKPLQLACVRAAHRDCGYMPYLLAD